MATNFTDITGLKFGKLTVYKRVDNKWLCLCDCGGYRYVHNINSLRIGKIKSCGCMQNLPTYGNRKYDIDIVRKSFENEGYVLLTDRYINSKQKLKYICPFGHKHTIDWSHWNLRGHRCPTCKFINMSGKNHWNWQAGKTPFTRCVRNFLKSNTMWFKDVLYKDNYVCQRCGSGGYLEAHHLVPISKIINHYNLFTINEVKQCDLLFDIDNGITLCLKCHTWVHSKRNINREHLHGF